MAEENSASDEGAASEASAPAEAAPARAQRGIISRFVRGTFRVLLLAVGPIAILAAGGWYWATGGQPIDLAA